MQARVSEALAAFNNSNCDDAIRVVCTMRTVACALYLHTTTAICSYLSMQQQRLQEIVAELKVPVGSKLDDAALACGAAILGTAYFAGTQ